MESGDIFGTYSFFFDFVHNESDMFQKIVSKNY